MKSIKSVIAMGLLTAAAAHAEPADNYPVNYDKCDLTITTPKNSSGYVVSRDCKTVYVLPPRKGAMDIQVSLNEGKLSGLCDAYNGNFRRYKLKSQILENTVIQRSKIENTPSHAAEIARLDGEISRLEAELRNITDPFREISGGDARMSVDASVTQNLINQFILTNLPLVREKQINFKPMPTNGGYLALTSLQVGDGLFADIRNIDLSLVPATSADATRRIFQMQSAANGHLDLGMGKGCDLWSRKQEALKRGVVLSSADLGRELALSLAPTFSYSFGVMSSVRYEASIDVQRAIKKFLDSEITKGQFRISDFGKLLNEGGANEEFQMNIDLGALADRFANQADRDNFMEKLRVDVRDRLTKRLLEHMNSILPIVDFPEDNKLSVPEPGTQNQVVGSERVCSSNRILGIKVSESCHDEAVIRRVNVDGTLDRYLNEVVRTGFEISEKVEINELLPARENVIF